MNLDKSHFNQNFIFQLLTCLRSTTRYKIIKWIYLVTIWLGKTWCEEDLVPGRLERVCAENRCPHSKSFVVCTCYRLPNSDMDLFNECNTFLQKRTKNWVGDLNCDVMKASPGAHTQQLILLCSLYQVRFRSMGKSAFRFCNRTRNPSSWWISIKISKYGFHGFLFYRSIGKSKKDLQNILVNSGLLFANYAFACKTAVFKNSLSILFRIPQKTERKGIQE